MAFNLRMGSVLAMTMALGAAAMLASAQTTPPATPAAPPAADGKPTLWLVGDSTMNNTAGGALGWAAPAAVGKLFDPAKINVQNKARGGRSARSYYSEGLWDDVKKGMKAGDYLIIAFGHNDGGDPKSATSKGRPDLPGLGDETTTGIASMGGKEETIHTFGWYMDLYVRETKDKGATPIMATMIPHNRWTQAEPATMQRGEINSYVKWSSDIARKENIYYIDVNNISAMRLEKEGKAVVGPKYYTPPGDGTHTNPAGALLNAESAVMGIRALKELKLNDYLSEEGKKLEPASENDVRRPEAAPAK